MRAKSRRAFSLVEMLVVIVVIAILAAVLLPRYLQGQGGSTTEGQRRDTPMQAAQSVECMNNIQQIRAAYQMAQTTAEEPVSGLTDLKAYGVTDGMLVCPVGHQPYQFDPATGGARCLYPGH